MWRVENRCIVCPLYFCCANCRWNHEQSVHGLTYDCPICRGCKYLCRPDQLNKDFIEHLTGEHLPLKCNKCNKTFENMDDLAVDKCTSVSEILGTESKVIDEEPKEVDKKFDSLYEKLSNNNIEDKNDIAAINKASRTAVITPTVHKTFIVDYESSDTECESSPKAEPMRTPYPKMIPKTPKFKRSATPHVKKLRNLMKQKAIEEYYEEYHDDSPVKSETTPSRNNEITIPEKQNEMTTPTSHVPVLLKLSQVVTTSTPTHPFSGGWSMFPEPGADSPLSEIENNESPAQSIVTEPSKIETAPKLKSIIVTGSKGRIGSQDSSEKQVTFQDSGNNTEASSAKAKKVKFADDTIFEPEPKSNRVYRKPKRMLTPGPQRQRFCHNPRFQALINRFESTGNTAARTPVSANRHVQDEHTPQAADHQVKPARAINFIEESSPGNPVDMESYSKESNELYDTCIESPQSSGLDSAISALTTNIAGTLHNCLSTAMKTTEEETEIQFKFVISKKVVNVHKVIEDGEVKEKRTEYERKGGNNKENIWSTVTKVVKNVLWGDRSSDLAITPHRSHGSTDTTSSSASKRKCDDLSDLESSPSDHKRHKFDGKIRGRPPLRRCKAWVESNLRNRADDGPDECSVDWTA